MSTIAYEDVEIYESSKLEELLWFPTRRVLMVPAGFDHGRADRTVRRLVGAR